MRLTLRTLLSYLDDTLEPAQAKVIGQKVAESEQARELMDRISQVTRRRRLTTPPTTGPGGLDPNTMAEYLDNEVTPEQAAEVEQVCLASDVHLAEVAACHQILTLVLGEPALVPPSAKQRMYGLVKGPEAIPFRKPSRGDSRIDQDLSSELSDADETLRLGLPAFAGVGGWRNLALLVGGGVAVAALLVVALILVLGGSGKVDEVQIAQGNNPEEVKPEKKADKTEQAPVPPPVPEKKNEVAKVEESKTPAVPAETKTTKKEEPLPDFPPLAEPDTTTVRVGRVLQAGPKELAPLLFQYADNKDDKEKSEWKRVGMGPKSDVFSARPLVALPGSHGTVQLNRGVQLTLAGNMPEFNQAPVYESMVELYPSDMLNADLTLRRGRILLINTGGDKPALVRVRFEDPKTGKQDAADVTLHTKDTTLLVERWSEPARGEPFYPNPKDRNRVGPVAGLNFVALTGKVSVRLGSPTYELVPAPGAYWLPWNSLRGVPEDPRPRETLIVQFQDNPELPKDLEKFRAAALKAEADFTQALDGKALDVVLNERIKEKDPATRRLVVRCYGATDDLPSLLTGMEDDSLPADVRANCVAVLREWIALRRDHAYDLFKVLKERYPKGGTALKVIELLHDMPPQRLEDPLTYETLIDDLDNPLLPIRELSAMNLYRLVPAGQKIAYSPTAQPRARAEAQDAWFRVVPRGQMPPRPQAAPPKKS